MHPKRAVRTAAWGSAYEAFTIGDGNLLHGPGNGVR